MWTSLRQGRWKTMPDAIAARPSAALSENLLIAARLDEFAGLLEFQGEDGFRIAAYRNATRQIEALTEPLRAIYEAGGTKALVKLSGIGQGIAGAIVELLTTGRWRQLDRLQGEVTPEALFQTIPGIGPELAHRLVDTLDVETLEELEAVLRLGDTPVPGIGPRRRAGILAALGQRLTRLRQRPVAAKGGAEPDIALLLDADRLYRSKAAAGTLRRIAPRRFNPTGEAWLPIMHARRGDWHLTLLFSNTARAHELERTRDWVVVYYHHGDGPEQRCTIVTDRKGHLHGKRVVRGREDECKAYYAKESADEAVIESGRPD